MTDSSFLQLTAEQRLKQVAAILARGVRRFHHRMQRSQSCARKDVPESLPDRLELPRKPRLTVSERFGG
ncbi:MAG: hypothetical protein KatS3mg109_0650 [Pirellulaceae bacterium]|nr:MAG: hypothetical protein KatS3mg109_0650 [Pirellulaceae bacterium]